MVISVIPKKVSIFSGLITVLDNAITCVEFDESGDYLAAGDKAGRVYVFNGSGEEPFYGMFCAFTSHESEFDYLKSLEIEEKINAIMWLPICNNSLQLLTTNDKVIKLWRMSEQSPTAYNFNFRQTQRNNQSCDDECPLSGSSSHSDPSPTSENNDGVDSSLKSVASLKSLRIPRYKKRKNLTIEVRSRKIYHNAHTYHINSLSLSSDQETFLSADDLRINLWHINHNEQSLQYVDIKPENMEDLNEVITCTRFHPELCNILGYSTSRGIVRLCDTRVKAVCDEPALFWDMRKGDRPCEVYSVHDPLKTQLVNLYESDAIFDKFLCSWSHDDRYLFTGSYGNVMRIVDRQQGSDWTYDLGDPEVRPSEPIIPPDNVNVPFLSLTPGRPLLRSHRLHPKCFIPLDSDVAKRFHLKSLCLANASSLETLNNSTSSVSSAMKAENKPSTDSPVAVGSKRRKQTLLPIRRTSDEIEQQAQDDEEDDGDPNSDDDEEDDFEFVEEEEDDKQCMDNIANGIQHHRHSHRRKVNGMSARSLLPGLQEVDFKKRFLQVACHPRRGLFVGVSGKEMFFISEDAESLPSDCNVEESEKLEEEETALDSTNQDTSLSSQPCPKRPCLREDEGEEEIALVELPSSPSQEFLLIENVTSEEPSTDGASKMDLE
nr:serine:threonine protein phosphatase 2A 55 kDa [Hymenolepis microstoma]